MINTIGSTVQIIGKEVTGVGTLDGPIYVPLKALCVFLGVNYDRQRSKIRNGSAFIPELVPIQGKDCRRRKMLCLRLEQIGDWASTIDPDTVRLDALEVLRSCLELPEESLWTDESQAIGNAPEERIERAYDCLQDMACLLYEFSSWIEEMRKYGNYFPGDEVRKASRKEVEEFVRRTRCNVRVVQAAVDAARQ